MCVRESVSLLFTSICHAFSATRTSQGQSQGHISRQRHSSQAAPAFLASSIQPISRDPPRHYDNQASSMAPASSSQTTEKPQFDRPRFGRGPLVRLRHFMPACPTCPIHLFMPACPTCPMRLFIPACPSCPMRLFMPVVPFAQCVCSCQPVTLAPCVCSCRSVPCVCPTKSEFCFFSCFASSSSSSSCLVVYLSFCHYFLLLLLSCCSPRQCVCRS